MSILVTYYQTADRLIRLDLGKSINSLLPQIFQLRFETDTLFNKLMLRDYVPENFYRLHNDLVRIEGAL